MEQNTPNTAQGIELYCRIRHLPALIVYQTATNAIVEHAKVIAELSPDLDSLDYLRFHPLLKHNLYLPEKRTPTPGDNSKRYTPRNLSEELRQMAGPVNALAEEEIPKSKTLAEHMKEDPERCLEAITHLAHAHFKLGVPLDYLLQEI